MYKAILRGRHKSMMRKLLLFLLLGSYVNVASAEGNDAIKSGTLLPASEPYQMLPVSNHIVSVDLLGLNYSYEHPIAKQSTIMFSAGLSYLYLALIGLELKEDDSGLSFEPKDYHLLTGGLSVEPRFYYNLNRRYRKGKRVRGNSGGYLSADVSLFFPVVTSRDIKVKTFYGITPYWGVRRVWRHFLFDMAGGISYVGTFEGSYGVSPTLRLILGYKF